MPERTTRECIHPAKRPRAKTVTGLGFSEIPLELSTSRLSAGATALSGRILRRRVVQSRRGHAPAKKSRGKTFRGGRDPPTKNGSDQAEDHDRYIYYLFVRGTF